MCMCVCACVRACVSACMRACGTPQVSVHDEYSTSVQVSVHDEIMSACVHGCVGRCQG